jgi:uncharacterized protein YbjT (DUF2867 family)
MPTITVFGLGAPSRGSATPIGRGVGGYCAILASNKGWHVKAVARDPDKYAPMFESFSNITIVKGDGLDRTSVTESLKGSEAAIFAIQAQDDQNAFEVDRDALIMIGEECLKSNIKLVVVSSLTTSPKARYSAFRLYANTVVKWNMMDAKWQGEVGIRKMNGLRYTIVRPGQFTNEASQNRPLQFGQFDTMSFWSMLSYISREDVAAVCMEAIESKNSDSVSVDVVGPKRGAQGFLNVKGVFDTLLKDDPAKWT